MYVLADAVSVMVCFGFGFFVVNTYDLLIIDFKSFVTYWPYVPAFILVFMAVRLYPGVGMAPAEELRRFAFTSFFVHFGIALAMYLEVGKLNPYSVAFLISWLVSVPGLLVGRAVARRLFGTYSWWGIPVAIFGFGQTGHMIVDRLLKNPWIGYRPVVIFDDNPQYEGEYKGVPVLVGLDKGKEVATSSGIQTALVAMPGVDRDRLYQIVGTFVSGFRTYVLFPDMFGMTNLWMSLHDIAGVLGLGTTQWLQYPLNRATKRFFDLAISIVGGLVASPIILLIMFLIFIESPGPVFYGHKRLGRFGKPFKSWKFRSMVRNSDEVLARHLAENPEAQAEWNESFKLRNDPRITKMGALLRRTSLDELPQIWNVIKGEMSLIGPRPIIQAEVERYGQYYGVFSSVLPGMSGLWQVSGRSDTNYAERVALDVYYVQSWSLWMDAHIFLKTFGVVLFGKGAY